MENLSEFKKRILLEDNHLIAINKQAKELAQGDKTGDVSLMDTVKDYLKTACKKQGNVFLGLPHRLDRPVSGVILFAKTSKALSRINEQIRNNTIEKTYWAIVKNKPPKEADHLVNWLIKDEKKNKSTAFASETKGAKKAELSYKILIRSEGYYLLEIELHTGRHHQIRVQLAKTGCPIKGDLKYGYPRSNKDASISLHARKLAFMHPVKKEKIEILAAPPDDALWNYFANACNLDRF